MSTWGVQPQGFVRPGYDEIVATLEDIARQPEHFGADADLTPYSPLGLLVQLAAYGFHSLWEANEDRYYNSFIDTASGVHLDRLCQLIGVYRKPPEYEHVTLLFTGDDFTVIPADFAVETKSGIQYRTDVSATIESGAATVLAKAVKLGVDQRVNSGQLTEIVNPQAGVLAVSNPAASEGGYAGEQDEELRSRAQEFVQVLANKSGAKSQLEVQILSVAGVQSVTVEENSRNVTWNGLLPNSIHCSVLGGEEADVAQAILYNKTAGTATNGSVSVAISDENGVEHTVYFDRPSIVAAYVKVGRTLIEGITDTTVVDNLIKEEIIKVIGGVHSYTIDGNPVSVEYTGLGAGEPLYELRLYKGISTIPELVEATISLGLVQGSENQSSLTVQPYEVLRCNTDYITIYTL